MAAGFHNHHSRSPPTPASSATAARSSRPGGRSGRPSGVQSESETCQTGAPWLRRVQRSTARMVRSRLPSGWSVSCVWMFRVRQSPVSVRGLVRAASWRAFTAGTVPCPVVRPGSVAQWESGGLWHRAAPVRSRSDPPSPALAVVLAAAGMAAELVPDDDAEHDEERGECNRADDEARAVHQCRFSGSGSRPGKVAYGVCGRRVPRRAVCIRLTGRRSGLEAGAGGFTPCPPGESAPSMGR